MDSPKRKRNSSCHDTDVCIVGIARTPIGNFMGSISDIEASQLGAVAIKAALNHANVTGDQVDEVIMGNVVSAGVGQGPARQAALLAGIPVTVPCTTVNKVCASGMKATTLAAQAIKLGERDIVVVGGMESMSKIPHYIAKARKGVKYGTLSCVDGIESDGLVDAYEKVAMGIFAERCAKKYSISRQQQDEHASESYRRSLLAIKTCKFSKEIVPLDIPNPRGTQPTTIFEDEEPSVRQVDATTLSKLKPSFIKEDGTVTAGNASPISDGAAALVLSSRKVAETLGLAILAIVRGYDDVEQEPENFTTSPSIAIPKALVRANLGISDVDYFEINEAFSVVALANMKILNLDPRKVNVYGGAVSLGHPLGCSGARIIVTLCSILAQENGRIGVAAVCNGGGGASAIVIEKPLLD